MTTTERVAAYLRTADLRKSYTVEVAQSLGASSANTLRRRLREEGTTLQALVEAEKKRRVHATLADRPTINAKRLAVIVGYDEANHFYRAFKSWFGQRWSDYPRQSALQEQACDR